MKKIVLFIVLLFTITACATGGNTNTPKETVTTALDYYKAQDFDNFSKYLTEYPDVLNLPGSSKSEAIKKANTDITYEIASESINGNKAEVVIYVSTINMGALLSKYINNVFAGEYEKEDEAAGELTTEQKKKVADERFDKLATDPNAEKIEVEITINLTKENDKWLIIPDAYFTEALTGFQNSAPQ